MNEHELQRQAKHRLAILRHAEEVTGSVAATCRYYGISRTRFYRWQQPYEAQGLAGVRDRSKRPHHSPTPPPTRSSAKSCTCASTTTSAR